MKSLKIFSVVLLLFCFQYPSFSAAPPNTQNLESLEYMRAIIRSLNWCTEARNLTSKAKGESDLLKQMTNSRLIIKKLSEAKIGISPYTKSQNEFISKTSQTFEANFDTAISIENDFLIHLEKLGNMSDEEMMSQRGTISSKLSQMVADYDEFWKNLSYTTALSTNSLIDTNRKVDDKTPYLLINSEQRKLLSTELENSFGDEIKGSLKGGQHAIIGAGAAIWQMLNIQGFKASDE